MAFTDPENNLSNLRVTEGMQVADFGVGSGIYTILLSKHVGNSGRVFAIDIFSDVLTAVRNKAEDECIKNIDFINADLEEKPGSKLKEGSIDAIVVSNILFQIEQKSSFISEIHRVLKDGGEVLIVEWSDSFGHFGPHHDHVLKKEDAIKIFTERGFSVDKEFDAGDHHYGLILKKNA